MGQLGEISQKFGFSHAASEVSEYVVDSNPHAADARLARALAGLHGNDCAPMPRLWDCFVLHSRNVLRAREHVNQWIRWQWIRWQWIRWFGATEPT